MHPVVQRLLALQQVDVKVTGLQRRLDSIPRETQGRRARLDEAEKRLSQATAERDKAELENQELEGKVRAIEGAVRRQVGHRDTAANASTFAAAQHQIDYLTQDKDNLQATQLELMERIKQLGPEIERLQAEVAVARDEFAAFASEAKRLENELRQQSVKIVEERRGVAAQIPEPSLAQYEAMFRTVDGQAVVPLEGDHCSGCYTRIPPNDRAYLLAGSSLVACKSCGRILYVPER
jgi:predicted  nucleic acid-binding Zn-ribbon protein